MGNRAIGLTRPELWQNIFSVNYASAYTVAHPDILMVCSRSIDGIAGLNPSEGTDVRLLCLLCTM